MNTETKRHIDAARQVLVGVVPNPTSQIDQITNALIYKFMDDMDQAAIKAGGDPSFFIGDLEHYAWTRLMDARMGNQERMNLYSEALMKFSEAKQLPELFRGIFKSAFLPYRSPEVLGLFLKEIDFFDYSHPEELGNAYEYLLSIMSSQGDAGQFRTPRHIIDFIVDVVNPTKDDKVLDPACGTGGFLVSSYTHILEQHDGKNDPEKKEKPLTPDQRRNLMNNFEGYDIDPSMVRIAQVNMYLHQFKNPKIFQYDSLSMEERWNDKFDVILANPPFMSPKGGVKTHSKFSVQSSRSEVLFVDYIMNHLRPKGRAGIIVPEGIIFQSGVAYKQLRKNLVKDGLYAVVSLPAGVFQPYSGVKTSILLFNNELAKVSQEIAFVKIENDGFDLGASKRPISKNDLPHALEILTKWGMGKKVESDLAIFIEKDKISETGDFNLSIERYRIAIDYANVKWPVVDLGNIAEVRMGETLLKGDLTGNGRPIYSADTSEDPWNYTDETKLSFGKRTVVIGARGTIGSIKFPNVNDFTCTQTTIAVSIGERALPQYVAYFLKNFNFSSIKEGVGIPMITVKNVSQIKIPLPPLEIQSQIVAEISAFQDIIIGAKKIINSWTPKITNDPQWENVLIGDVAKVQGGFAFKGSDMIAKGGVQIIKIGNVKNQRFDFKNNPSFVEASFYDNHSDYQLSIGDILISMTGTAGKRDYGNVCMVDVEGKFLLNQRVGKIIPNLKVDNSYLFFALNQSETKDKFYSNATGGVRQGNISNKQIEAIEISLPPLEIQKRIAEEIEAESAIVYSNNKLIEIYEQKTKDTLARLWV